MPNNVTSRYSVRRAKSEADRLAVHTLRVKAFAAESLQAADSFDARCEIVLIENAESQSLVASFRLLFLSAAHEIEQSYSAQFYDLSNLERLEGAALEIGRFCIDPAQSDPEILRVAWGAIAGYVDEKQVQFLFGCSSFNGTDATPYRDALALLRAKHLAPPSWEPKMRTAKSVALPVLDCLDNKQAQASLPPLLRSYLLMGGWVSDHAVVDAEMNTLHVFTGLQVGAIPAARKRLLRANALKIA